MDSRKCQTSTATPPEAGGLPCLASGVSGKGVRDVKAKLRRTRERKKVQGICGKEKYRKGGGGIFLVGR